MSRHDRARPAIAGISPRRLSAISPPGRRKPRPAGRRKWHFDGIETLAAYIASTSDLDDLIPDDRRLSDRVEQDAPASSDADDRSCRDRSPPRPPIPPAICPSAKRRRDIGDALAASPSDWDAAASGLGRARSGPISPRSRPIGNAYTLRMLGGSYVGYTRATRQWWRRSDRCWRRRV